MSHETHELLPAEWTATWRSATLPRLDEVIARTRARTRRQGLEVLAELAGAVIGMAMLLRLAGADLHPADRPFAVLYAMAVAVLGWFALYNTEGTWRPREDTSLAHARLQMLRAERRVRSVRAAWVFLALSVLLYVPWILARVQSESRILGAFTLLAVIVGLYALGLHRALRGARRERASWAEVCAQLGD